MSFGRLAAQLTLVFFMAGCALCPASVSAAGANARQANHSSGLSYAGPRGDSGYVDLSQDEGSGAGFYALPAPYKAEARRQRAVQYRNDSAAIGTAIASEAIEYDYDEGYAFGNGHGVFDPVDGVGTPFFGGYYH